MKKRLALFATILLCTSLCGCALSPQNIIKKFVASDTSASVSADEPTASALSISSSEPEADASVSLASVEPDEPVVNPFILGNEDEDDCFFPRQKKSFIRKDFDGCVTVKTTWDSYGHPKSSYSEDTGEDVTYYMEVVDDSGSCVNKGVNADGSLNTVEHYDSNNVLIQMDYYSDNKRVGTTMYNGYGDTTYASYGANLDDPSEPYEYSEYTYDDIGYLIKSYSTNDNLLYVYKRDSYGQPLSTTAYDADTRDWVSVANYDYDQNGNLYSVTYEYADSQELEVMYYEYDSDNRVISQTTCTVGYCSCTEYSYDSYGNCIYEANKQTEFFEDLASADPYYSCTTTYDGYGNVTREETFWAGSFPLVNNYSYAYDDEGNVLIKEMYEDQTLIYTEYYEYY